MNALDGFRGLYCLWIGVAVAWQWRGHAAWVRARGDARGLPLLFERWAMPRFGLAGFNLLGVGLLACLILAAVPAVAPAWPLLGASGLALAYFAQVIELPSVKRKPNSVPVILFLLGVAACAKGDSAGRVVWLSLLLIKATVAQIYLSSAIAKFQQSGWRWPASNTLRIALLRYALRDDNRAAGWLARRGTVCRVAALLVMGFELTFWLTIPFPALAWFYLPAGLLFHLGVAWTMRIHYWIYVFPAYLAFVVGR